MTTMEKKHNFGKWGGSEDFWLITLLLVSLYRRLQTGDVIMITIIDNRYHRDPFLPT